MSWVVAYEIIACRNIWVCILSHVGSDLWLSEAVVTVWKDPSHCTDIQTSVHILCFYRHPLHQPLLFGSLWFFLPCNLSFNLFCHSEFSPFQLSIGNLFTSNPFLVLPHFFVPCIYFCNYFSTLPSFVILILLSYLSLFCEFFMILSVCYYFLLCCFNPAYFGHFDSFFLFFFSTLSFIFFIYNGQLSICYNSKMLYVVT